MLKSIKKLLITGASLLMLAGVSTGVGQMAKPIHASAGIPEYYHSTRSRHNIYYGYLNNKDHWRYLYGKMPKLMRKRGHIFALYYGKYYDKVNFMTKKLDRENGDRLYHFHGQTYVPDYVGYTDPRNKIHYHGHTYFISRLLINKKDIGRPVKHQMHAENHTSLFNSIKYIPIHSHKHGHHHHHKRMMRHHHSHRHDHKHARY